MIINNNEARCFYCAKEDVCKHKEAFKQDCVRIETMSHFSEVTEVRVECSKYRPFTSNVRTNDQILFNSADTK